MKTMSARAAKNAFGLMIDTARAEPLLIEKHGRPVVMIISVEAYERLNNGANGETAPSKEASLASATKRGRAERA
jgi:prevent-host-death family protein